MPEIELNLIIACRLHPDTWEKWIRSEVIEHVPYEVPVSISCLPSDTLSDAHWVIMTKQNELVWTNKEFTLLTPKQEPEVLSGDQIVSLFAKLLRPEQEAEIQEDFDNDPLIS